jgi:hypothetical protein
MWKASETFLRWTHIPTHSLVKAECYSLSTEHSSPLMSCGINCASGEVMGILTITISESAMCGEVEL